MNRHLQLKLTRWWNSGDIWFNMFLSNCPYYHAASCWGLTVVLVITICGLFSSPSIWMVVPFCGPSFWLERLSVWLCKEGHVPPRMLWMPSFYVLWHQKLPIILLPLLCFYTSNILHRLYYLKKLLESLSIFQPVGAAVDLLVRKGALTICSCSICRIFTASTDTFVKRKIWMRIC